MDPDGKLNEIFYSLAGDPEFYALFKLIGLLVENEKGDKLFEEYKSKYDLENGRNQNK
jgi:hypothetical protein